MELLQNTGDNPGKQAQISEELHIQRAREESINRKKSRELWFENGNRNSKFFHSSTIIRHQRNRINYIHHGSRLIQREEEIIEYFTSKFSNLFTSSRPQIPNELDNLFTKNVSEEEN